MCELRRLLIEALIAPLILQKMYLQLQILLGLIAMRCRAACTLKLQNPVVYKASVTISPADSADFKMQHSNLFLLIFYVLILQEQLATGVNMLLRYFNYQLCFITFLYYLYPNLFHKSVIEIVF